MSNLDTAVDWAILLNPIVNGRICSCCMVLNAVEPAAHLDLAGIALYNKVNNSSPYKQPFYRWRIKGSDMPMVTWESVAVLNLDLLTPSARSHFQV